MAEDNSAKLGLAAAIITAVGAISAAVLPVFLSRPAPDPVAPTKIESVAAAKTEVPAAIANGKKASGPKRIADIRVEAGRSKDAIHNQKSAKSKMAPSDQSRLQGDWEEVAHTAAAKVLTKEDIARTKTRWEFDGDKLVVRNHGDAPGRVYYEGHIKLHPDFSPKKFDFAGKNRTGQAVEMLGIYAFEGPVLVLRYYVDHVGDSEKPRRPEAFKIEPGPKAGSLVRLRRSKE